MPEHVTIPLVGGTCVGAVSAGVLTVPGLRYAVGAGRDSVRSLAPGEPIQVGPLAFPQRPGALDALLGPALGELGQSEDAFQLTVQAPIGAAGLPVVFFIPGGGFLSGSGQSRWYSDAGLVTTAGVVLVTVNYRIGALGHALSGADAAAAPISDLVRALAWVQANIGAFGGDPEQLTLAGDSAGAWYAYALCRTPETVGWIRRALLVSLPRIAPLPAADATQYQSELFDQLGARSVATAETEEVLDAQAEVAGRHRAAGFVWRPAESGATPAWFADFRRSATDMHVRDVLLLRTAEESAGFMRNRPAEDFTADALAVYIRQTFAEPVAVRGYLASFADRGDPYLDRVRAQTLAEFTLPTFEIAEALEGSGEVAIVRLDLQSGLDRARSPHCLTLPFVFDNLEHWHDAPMLDGVSTDDAVTVARGLQAVVREFVLGESSECNSEFGWSGETLVVDAAGTRAVREPGRGIRLRGPSPV